VAALTAGIDRRVYIVPLGAARRGHGKVERGHRWGSAKAERGYRWSAGKRSAGSHFYPYRTRIGSHNLALATLCTEYAMYMLSIYIYP
jgi:hypothetical protein